MASKYWVGGDGNWSSLTNWRTTSGGAVVTTPPILTDAAILDANSSTSVVTVDSNITVQTLTCTGFTGTLAFGTNTISLNSTGTIFTGVTTMTVTGTPQIILTNNSATARTITPAAVTEANSISFRITAGTGTFTITTSQGVRDLDFTDGVNPTGYAGALQGGNVNIYGNLKVSTGMTVVAGTGIFNFNATSGTKTINTAGVTFDRPFTFNGVGGAWQLQAALTSGVTRNITLTAGTLDLNGYTATCNGFISSNTNTRTLAFGSTGKLVLVGSGGTLFSGSASTNQSVTGTNPLVQFTYSGGASTRNIIMWPLPEAQSISVEFLNNATDTVVIQGPSGGYRNIDFTNFNGTVTTANTPRCFGNFTIGSNVSSVSGTSAITFASTSGTKTITSNGKTLDCPIAFDGVGGAWTCTDALTLGSTRTLTLTNGTLKLKSGVTSTVGAFATSGTTMKYLQSSTTGTQATISDASGTNDVSYLTIQDSNATGGATWNSFYDQSNINAGNNAGWYFGDSPTVGNEITMRLRSFTQPRRF
jgi:hypothetical protein